MDEKKTMSIREFAKSWGIGEPTMRKIIEDNPDFPCLVINNKTTKRKPKKLVLIEQANRWIERNLRQ